MADIKFYGASIGPEFYILLITQGSEILNSRNFHRQVALHLPRREFDEFPGRWKIDFETTVRVEREKGKN